MDTFWNYTSNLVFSLTQQESECLTGCDHSVGQIVAFAFIVFKYNSAKTISKIPQKIKGNAFI